MSDTFQIKAADGQAVRVETPICVIHVAVGMDSVMVVATNQRLGCKVEPDHNGLTVRRK